MWSSSGRNNDNNKNNNNNNNSSPSKSKSSSTCSSPSPFPPLSPNKTTMEEVWRDISLSSLHDHSSTAITNATSNKNNSPQGFPSLILQDFLARPFNKDSPTKAASTTEPSSLGDITSFGSLKSPIATMLSLNSGSDFQYPETGAPDPIRPSQHLNSHVSIGGCSFGCSENSAFEALGSPSVVPHFYKKRAQENEDYSDDRRHKRMIKNRESAARSRARKQAYTNELELEVAHLVEENAKLRRQQEKLLAASALLPKKRTLYRTSTAPF